MDNSLSTAFTEIMTMGANQFKDKFQNSVLYINLGDGRLHSEHVEKFMSAMINFKELIKFDNIKMMSNGSQQKHSENEFLKKFLLL